MKLESPLSKAPTGKARELNESRKTWSTLEVKNKVVWVNDQIDFPFNIKLGQKTDLAAVLSLDPIDTRKVELEVGHTRSAILGRVIFKDKQCNLYRDVDLKGIGYSMSGGEGLPEVRTSDDIDAPRLRKGEVAGFQSMEAANYDNFFAEKLIKLGIRTDRVVAIAELKEIPATEGIISVEEARRLKIIPPDFTPAVSIRAFGTRTRFGEGVSVEKERLFYEDARKLIAEELGMAPENFNWSDYVKWFAKNIARNIGLLHKNGMYYKYALNIGEGPSNVSLDCRLVDHESVGYLKHFKSKGMREKLIRTDLYHIDLMVLSMNEELSDLFDVNMESDLSLSQIIQSTYQEIGNSLPPSGDTFEQ